MEKFLIFFCNIVYKITLDFQRTGRFIFYSMKNIRRQLVSFFALFGSTSTLICCALPAIIASFAGGAAVASLVSAFPFLVILSKFKAVFFIFGGLLLATAGFLIFRPKSKIACTITGEGCETADRFSKFTFWISLIIYGVGFFFAYLAVPVMRWLGI